MRTVLITTAIRPTATESPPIGELSILNAMRKNGIDNFEFYNIDANRPLYEEALSNIIESKPEIIFKSVVFPQPEGPNKVKNSP